MTKKYIKVDFEPLDYNFIRNLNPRDIIFIAHWADTNYDRESEKLGYFILVVFKEYDRVRSGFCSVNSWEFVEEYMKNLDDLFTKNSEGILFNYFNKEMLPDLDIKSSTMIYKDEYKFKSDLIIKNLIHTSNLNIKNGATNRV